MMIEDKNHSGYSCPEKTITGLVGLHLWVIHANNIATILGVYSEGSGIQQEC